MKERNPRICSKEKPCCIHNLCGENDDVLCCASCEPKALEIEFSYEKGFHNV